MIEVIKTLKFFSPENIEFDLIANDIAKKSFITTQTTKGEMLMFSETSFFKTILGFSKSEKGVES